MIHMKQIFEYWSLGLPLIAAALVLTGCSREAKETRYLARANRYFEAKQFDRAEIEYLNVLRLDSKNVVALSRLGAIYYSKGDLLRSLPYLAGAERQAPDELDTRIKLGRILSLARQFPRAP